MNRFRMLSAFSLLAMVTDIFAQSQNMTMQIAGVSRKYIQYTPSGLGSNPPLVFVIHGFNMSGQQEVQLTKMNAVADREKFIVVYPDALPDASNQQSWDMSGKNDYAFLLAIVDTVAAKSKIDKNKVYASGFSQGGFFSFQLGCRYADIFAAIAPVSGLLQGSCSPKRPVPMIFTFGTNEGFDVNGFIQSGDKWVQLNGCATTPTVQKPYPASNTRSVVTRSTYTSCKEGAEVVTQSVEGGTHEWPMNTQTKVNNSEEVWAFFKRFSLPSVSAIPSHSKAPKTSSLSVHYSQGRIRLHGADENAWVQVLDHRGRVLASQPAVEGFIAFEGRPSGVYQVRINHQGKSFSLRMAIP